MHRCWALLRNMEKIAGYWHEQNRFKNYLLRFINIFLLSSILFGFVRRHDILFTTNIENFKFE